MPKPKTVRNTTHPLGVKINLVMEIMGIAGDYVALAKIFGIAVPSTYSWIDKGTVSKEHYPKLAEWSGRSLDWWFDVPASVVRQVTHLVRETPQSDYNDVWPFRSDIRDFRQLPPEDRARADGFISGLIAANSSNIPKTTLNRSNGHS